MLNDGHRLGDTLRPVILARELWHRLEHVHAVVYFAPQCDEALRATGLRGFWMGYFAGRAAPMGAVDAPLVAATFFNFHPDMVRRSIPDAWSYATPADVLEARRTSSITVLREVVPDIDGAARAALPLLRPVIAGLHDEGRPLCAANRALDPGDDPVGELWQHATTLREHRGDGHVALLTAAGLDGCEAHVVAAAAKGLPRDMVLRARGWSEDDWTRAVDDLRARGWIDTTGGLTDEGRVRYEEIERRTDELAMRPYEVLGTRVQELVDLLTPMRDAVVASGVIPYPNPMGLPPQLDDDVNAG